MIKFFVFLFLSLHYVAEAQRNRSTVWVLANNQIYSTNAGYAACSATGTTTPTTNTFLTTSNLRISGSLYGVVDARAALTPWADTLITPTTTSGHALIDSLTIIFYYNSTYFLTLTLPTARATGVQQDNAIPIASYPNFLLPVRRFTLTSSITTLPADATNVYQPNGKVWLTFSAIAGVATDSTGTLTASNVYSYGFVVNDYISSSTISVVQWVDNLNAFYQFGANVLTSSITGSSILNSGCSSVSVGKRSVDHFRFKRDAAGSTCPTSSNDATFSSTTLTSLCTRSVILTGTGACGGTGVADSTSTTSCFADALTRGVRAIDALSTQSVVFSTSGPRIISGGAHYLLLIGSMLFLLF